MKKLALVIGASPNPERYSYLAVERLKQHAYPVRAIGLRPGEINGVKIETGHPYIENVDTVTLYVNPLKQENLYNYVLLLKPRRVIFNPGAENAEFASLLNQQGIETTDACTLVLLSTGQY